MDSDRILSVDTVSTTPEPKVKIRLTRCQEDTLHLIGEFKTTTAQFIALTLRPDCPYKVQAVCRSIHGIMNRLRDLGLIENDDDAQQFRASFGGKPKQIYRLTSRGCEVVAWLNATVLRFKLKRKLSNRVPVKARSKCLV